ncbi:MAG: hypothetical protein WCL50_00495 [Spirochaetota bacterium]
MNAPDRWKHELDETLRRLGQANEAKQAEALGNWLSSSFRGLPTDLVDALLEGLAGRLKKDHDKALAWLGAIGSILLLDYDGTPLDKEDWLGIREAFSDFGEDVDLELLTYAMGLVVERGLI